MSSFDDVLTGWSASSIAPLCDAICNYFTSLTGSMVGSQTGPRLVDHELRDVASDCSLVQAAGFLVFWGKIRKNWYHYELGLSLFSNLDSDTLFQGKYNVAANGEGTFDLAEVGACFATFFDTQRSLPATLVSSVVEKVENQVLDLFADTDKAFFYKNKNALDLIIPNGDVYAAMSLGLCDRIMGTSHHSALIELVVERLISTFNTDIRLGWPYSYHKDGSVHIGFSLAYQATIVAWGYLIIDCLSDGVAQRWSRVLRSAHKKVLLGHTGGTPEMNEATSWTRNWDNIWEIELSLSRFTGGSTPRSVAARLEQIASEFMDRGLMVFDDDRTSQPGRTVIGSRFRKTANFCAVFQSMITNSSNLLSYMRLSDR